MPCRLDKEDAQDLYLDETVRRMVASVRSAIYTIVEDLLETPELPASAASREAAVKGPHDS